jgi:hypothetical protein
MVKMILPNEKMIGLCIHLRIKTAFQILQNVLSRFYPNTAVNSVIWWLKYQCNTKHTDEPWKDFFKMYNIWHLWPYKWSN